MRRRLCLISVGLIPVLLLTFAGCARAPQKPSEPFPSKPVKVLIGGSPGDAYDTIARKLAVPLSEKLGVRVLPMNVLGPRSVDLFEAVNSAEPDGYTVGFAPSGTMREHILQPGLLRWEITTLPTVLALATPPFVVFASAKSKIKTANDLWATKEPIRAAIWTGFVVGIGSLAIVAQQRNVTLLPVVYESYGDAQTGTIRGDADIIAGAASGVTLRRVASKEYIPLLVWGKQRYPDLPDVPSSRELGLPPELDATQQHRVFFTTPGTPPDRIAKLAEALKASIANPDIAKWSKDTAQPLGIMTTDEYKKEFDALTAIYRQYLQTALREFMR